MNGTMLSMTLFLMGERIRLLRICVASILGGMGAVLILLSGIKYGEIYILFIILIEIIMMMVVLNKEDNDRNKVKEKRFLIGLVYFNTLAFGYMKLEECIVQLGVSFGTRQIVVVMVCVCIIVLSWYQNNKRTKNVYKVRIIVNTECVECNALLDTGNSLVDPISGKTVSVVEENENLRKWICEYPEKYKIIPFKSIGNESGVLEGVTVDELVIEKGNYSIVRKQEVVALYKGSLSTDNSFQMILNRELI